MLRVHTLRSRLNFVRRVGKTYPSSGLINPSVKVDIRLSSIGKWTLPRPKAHLLSSVSGTRHFNSRRGRGLLMLTLCGACARWWRNWDLFHFNFHVFIPLFPSRQEIFKYRKYTLGKRSDRAPLSLFFLFLILIERFSFYGAHRNIPLDDCAVREGEGRQTKQRRIIIPTNFPSRAGIWLGYARSRSFFFLFSCKMDFGSVKVAEEIGR